MENQPPVNFIQAYRTIADNTSERISHRLVIEGKKVKTKGLWGRFVIFLSELGRPEKLTENKKQVLIHFEDAIKKSFLSYGSDDFNNQFQCLKTKLKLENRSLRARDVREFLKEADKIEKNQEMGRSQLKKFSENTLYTWDKTSSVPDLSIRQNSYQEPLISDNETHKPKENFESSKQNSNYDITLSSDTEANVTNELTDITPPTINISKTSEAKQNTNYDIALSSVTEKDVTDGLTDVTPPSVNISESSEAYLAYYKTLTRKKPSDETHKFRKNVNLFQVSKKIQILMTPERSKLVVKILNYEATKFFMNFNRLSPDEMCLLILATHFKDSAEEIRDASKNSDEITRYDLHLKTLYKALDKIQNNKLDVTFIDQLDNTDENDSKSLDYYTENLNNPITYNELLSHEILSKDGKIGTERNQIINQEIREDTKNSSNYATVIYKSTIGKVVHIGKSRDEISSYIVFKPGSMHTIVEAHCSLIKDDTIGSGTVFSNMFNDNILPLQNNLRSSGKVTITVTNKTQKS